MHCISGATFAALESQYTKTMVALHYMVTKITIAPGLYAIKENQKSLLYKLSVLFSLIFGHFSLLFFVFILNISDH